MIDATYNILTLLSRSNTPGGSDFNPSSVTVLAETRSSVVGVKQCRVPTLTNVVGQQEASDGIRYIPTTPTRP